MTRSEKIAIIALAILSCFGCADSRVQRSDEEAMMMYRYCMEGMPPQWDSRDVSAGLDSKHVASVSASADSRRQSRQHTECMQRAAWEEE
jgi:hypothetical protein